MRKRRPMSVKSVPVSVMSMSVMSVPVTSLMPMSPLFLLTLRANRQWALTTAMMSPTASQSRRLLVYKGENLRPLDGVSSPSLLLGSKPKRMRQLYGLSPCLLQSGRKRVARKAKEEEHALRGQKALTPASSKFQAIQGPLPKAPNRAQKRLGCTACYSIFNPIFYAIIHQNLVS